MAERDGSTKECWPEMGDDWRRCDGISRCYEDNRKSQPTIFRRTDYDVPIKRKNTRDRSQ